MNFDELNLIKERRLSYSETSTSNLEQIVHGVGLLIFDNK